MALESAKLFVTKMREDNGFRKQVSSVADKNAFWDLVKNENFNFDERDLAGAMAACMSDMEAAAAQEHP